MSRPQYEEEIPGKRCPFCGEVREEPSHQWVLTKDAPHEDLRDCIRFLAIEIASMRDRLDDHRL